METKYTTIVDVLAQGFPIRSPAPRASPRNPKTITIKASAVGPEAIPDRTDTPPNSEKTPPAMATIPTTVTPTGLLRFGLDADESICGLTPKLVIGRDSGRAVSCAHCPY